MYRLGYEPDPPRAVWIAGSANEAVVVHRIRVAPNPGAVSHVPAGRSRSGTATSVAAPRAISATPTPV